MPDNLSQVTIRELGDGTIVVWIPPTEVGDYDTDGSWVSEAGNAYFDSLADAGAFVAQVLALRTTLAYLPPFTEGEVAA
ncbi:MAG TPA: hypothetical protein VMX12_02505 [Acidimicrobiia bacterium]|nr:hypothetical protein [Acidimicrobiia bacterium]